MSKEVIKIQLVDYSEKSIAIFGNTYPIKESIKDLKGKFAGALKHEAAGYMLPGWTISKKNSEEAGKALFDMSNVKIVKTLVETFADPSK